MSDPAITRAPGGWRAPRGTARSGDCVPDHSARDRQAPVCGVTVALHCEMDGDRLEDAEKSDQTDAGA